MLLSYLVRPFNAASYALYQRVNLIFGVVVVAVLLIAVIAWLTIRWRTRDERRDHAALRRVRERIRLKTPR